MEITVNPIPVNTGGSAFALIPRTTITIAINASRINKIFFMMFI
jgi:hypothetical protein